MTEEDFNILVKTLRNGDNTALAALQPFQESCIRRLVIKSGGRCDEHQGYDIFIDSLLDFRKNVLAGKVIYQNIPAYLQRICWYKWLETSRKRQRHQRSQDMIKTQLYPKHEDHRGTVSVETEFSDRLAQVEAGMQELSEKCRQVITMAIAEGQSMSEIATQLGMASSDVAKTTKSRCYKRLIELIRTQQIP
jgi:RNA polymerase sigma factor (sigma-70 family)